MASRRKDARTVAKFEENRLKLRNSLWPSLDEKLLWKRREKKGWITLPRTLPLIFQIMDDLSSGKPVSNVYFDLWSRAFDECFVTLSDHQAMAFAAGYKGQRSVATWSQRMRTLGSMGFIDLKSGAYGPLSYALIFNPYFIIQFHHEKKTPGFSHDVYNALRQRVIDIGAKDFDEIGARGAAV